MRLFFHLKDRYGIIRDLHGVEVNDVDQAHTEAVRALRELQEEGGTPASDWSGSTLIITDAGGTVVLSIDLDSYIL